MKVARSDGAAAAVAALADRIAELAESASGDFCIAFSGGESAKSLYPGARAQAAGFFALQNIFCGREVRVPRLARQQLPMGARAVFGAFENPRRQGVQAARRGLPRGRRRGGLESRRGESPVGGRVPAIRLRRARNRSRHAHGIHFPRHHGASRLPENIRRLPYEIFGILADYPNGKSNFERARNSRARFGRIQGAGFVAARSVRRGGDFSTPAAAVFGRAKNCTVFAGF